MKLIPISPEKRMSPNPDDAVLWEERHKALYAADLSALYHQKRERFFELVDKYAKVVALVGGSAPLWKLATTELVIQISMLISITSALSLVFGFSDRSKKHADLARGFKGIAGDIVGTGQHHFDQQDINDWNRRLYALEISEPPALSALVILCQNELALAAGQEQKVVPQPFWRRLLAHLFDMPHAA